MMKGSSTRVADTHPGPRRVFSALTTVGLTAALSTVSLGVASAATTPVLNSDPTSSPVSTIVLAPGATQQITISNAGGSRSSSALMVSLTQTPTAAGFHIVSDGCTGLAIGPRKICKVTVGLDAATPTGTETARLTVASKTRTGVSSTSYFSSPDPVNQPPVANFDVYSVALGSTLIVPAPGVLANDTDPDGDLLSMVVASAPLYGSLTFDPDGSFTYSSQAYPPGGVDSFYYMASDGHSDSNLTLVDIIVTQP